MNLNQAYIVKNLDQIVLLCQSGMYNRNIMFLYKIYTFIFIQFFSFLIFIRLQLYHYLRFLFFFYN